VNSNPILVHSNRGPIVESYHRGAICVVNENKEIVFSCGDVNQLCYPRSAMKFFQQIPLLVMGGIEKYDLTFEEIAILCGSHNGENKHVDVVRSILKKGGFTEEDLECGPQMPTHRIDQEFLIKNEIKPQRIHNNCSGKHAGFLLLCKLMNVEHKNYIDPNHPIQKEIAQTIAKYYEVDSSSLVCGIDGCSAPIYAFTLLQQAKAYANLVNPIKFNSKEQKACEILVSAVTQFPFMLAGSKRYCSELMEIIGNKVIGKTGADGVYCLALKNEKWGIALKIDDGKMGPQYNVAQALLEQSGILNNNESEKLSHYLVQENKNFGGLHFGNTCVNPEINLNFKP